MMSQLIAVLGGTFDPVHNAHLFMATQALSILHCHEVLFIPCKTPIYQHNLKICHANVTDRLRMLELALEKKSNMRLSRIEIDRNEPSYTVLTLESLKKQYPHASFILLMGADTFDTLPTWHQSERILSLANIAVFDRNKIYTQENTVQALQIPTGCIIRMPMNHAISSTRIREAISQHQKDLPKAVFDYIQSRQLYIPVNQARLNTVVKNKSRGNEG